ncbi:MAG: universal stress protein [Alphaproteobacteria bacterium]|nr:universal stress protein [Alphaproteobacteria bacterium]
MPSVILAVLDHPPAADRLLAAATCLADLIGGARINALLVRTPPEATILPGDEVLTLRREAEIRAIGASRAAAVKAVFDAWAVTTPLGGTARWVDVEGLVEDVVKDWGRRADWIVVERPAHHDYGTTWHGIRAALFTTDRPVLVVPSTLRGPFGRRVAIAWRDDRRNDEHTTKAVLAALRCLTRAAQVHLLAGLREGAGAPVIPAILSEHDLPVELHVLPIGTGAFGAALLAEAHRLGADMLVIGAYVHHPLHGWLLGGVTRYVLAHADLPVLMRH